jgi:hypothetical protein
MFRRLLICALLSLFWAGCAGAKEQGNSEQADVGVLVAADQGAPAVVALKTPDISAEDGNPEPAPEELERSTFPPGSTSGRIVNAAGEGLDGIIILSCTTSICVSGETKANGEYYFEQIDPEPQKMQSTDVTGAYMSMLFYQEVVSGEHRQLIRDVVMPERVTEIVAWPEGKEGEILLAGGALSLTVAPGALDYPLGFFDETLRAEAVPEAQLPPFDVEPWTGKEEGTLAFVFYPLHIVSEPAATIQVLQGVTAPEGSQFTLWSVDPDSSRLESVGTASVGSDGVLSSHTDSKLKNLSLIVFIPEG